MFDRTKELPEEQVVPAPTVRMMSMRERVAPTSLADQRTKAEHAIGEGDAASPAVEVRLVSDVAEADPVFNALFEPRQIDPGQVQTGLGDSLRRLLDHSHSMVPGGFEVTS